MNVVAWTLGVALVAAFALAGLTKLFDLDRLRDHLGHSKREFQAIGLCELAGAAGIVVGLVSTKLEWIAVAAGVALCSLMVAALMAHARVGDEGKKTIPAAMLFMIGAAFLVAISLR